jgi:hypothetical protein
LLTTLIVGCGLALFWAALTVTIGFLAAQPVTNGLFGWCSHLARRDEPRQARADRQPLRYLSGPRLASNSTDARDVGRVARREQQRFAIIGDKLGRVSLDLTSYPMGQHDDSGAGIGLGRLEHETPTATSLLVRFDTRHGALAVDNHVTGRGASVVQAVDTD